MRRPQNLKKISHLFWQNSCFYSVASKQVGDFFKFLWSSHKSWTLLIRKNIWDCTIGICILKTNGNFPNATCNRNLRISTLDCSPPRPYLLRTTTFKIINCFLWKYVELKVQYIAQISDVNYIYSWFEKPYESLKTGLFVVSLNVKILDKNHILSVCTIVRAKFEALFYHV